MDGVSFILKQGEKTALLGPSGAGKSTILSLIQGALAPSKGNITLNDISVQSLQGEISRVVSVSISSRTCLIRRFE
ncbi:ATP-binding cassette domain-containing protein [Bacillus licheniformis]|nr:ATP-binding cassette domain-containing protein [Bacillus licheniformis]